MTSRSEEAADSGAKPTLGGFLVAAFRNGPGPRRTGRYGDAVRGRGAPRRPQEHRDHGDAREHGALGTGGGEVAGRRSAAAAAAGRRGSAGSEPVEPESVAEAEALTESDGDGVVVGVAGGSFPSPGFTVDGSTSSPTTQARVCVSLTFVPSARVALTVKVVR